MTREIAPETEPAEARRRLAETIFWCQELADPAHGLRSPALRPEGYPYAPDLRFQDVAAAQAAVDALAGRRRQLLASTGYPAPLLPDRLGGGRVLIAPALAVNPHAARCESASGGFIDLYGLPPWDTWLAILLPRPHSAALGSTGAPPALLACWVPVNDGPSAAGAALRADPTGTLRWATDLELRALGAAKPASQPGSSWLSFLNRPLQLPVSRHPDASPDS